MNSRRLTRTPYRLISRARELRLVTSRQMIADFGMSRDTLARSVGNLLAPSSSYGWNERVPALRRAMRRRRYTLEKTRAAPAARLNPIRR